MSRKAFEILTDTISSLKLKELNEFVEETPLESLELDSLGEFELVMALEENLDLAPEERLPRLIV